MFALTADQKGETPQSVVLLKDLLAGVVLAVRSMMPASVM